MNRRLLITISTMLAVGGGALFGQAPNPDSHDNPTGNTGALKPQITTAGSYDAHSGNGTRIVTDLQVPGALGVYGLDFARYWNSLPVDRDNPDAAAPSDFGNSAWSHSWGWSAVYNEDYPVYIPSCDCDNGTYTTSISITFPDGHVLKYKIARYAHTGFTAPDSSWGPPYSPAEVGDWAVPPGESVHDYLGMSADGSEFWLYLADGGSIHFQGDPGTVQPGGHPWYSYQADRVLDPHGFETDLTYNGNGDLRQVTQEGGRWLLIDWSSYAGWAPETISRVTSGRTGTSATQYVDYTYSGPDSSLPLVLTTVIYPETHPDSSRPDHRVFASYTYGPDPETTAGYKCGLRLITADDPRFAGPMHTIRYSYLDTHCTKPLQAPNPIPPGYYDRFYALSNSIVAEQSGDTLDGSGQPVTVSRFALHCLDGTRTEWNGFGAWRIFYFGSAASTGANTSGFETGKVTDYTTTSADAVPNVRQSFRNGEPYEVWDGRNIKTVSLHEDGSGLPTEIDYPDGSAHFYDRIHPGASAQRDQDRIPNPYHHWLFSETDERHQTTTYQRDSRRRVTDIIYPGTAAEHFIYNDFNQVTSYTLASSAVQTYLYDDASTHHLLVEYNSVDGWDARKEYTYGDPLHPGLYDDLVHTMTDGRARSSGAPYSVLMEYNGRNQIIKVHYAPTPGSSDPHVTYGYDSYGNCTSITDEMGHTSLYEYDSYRRCISYTEPLNAPDAWDNNMPSRRWDWIYDRYIVDNNYYPVGGGYDGASTHTVNSWRIQIEPGFNYLGERPMTHRFHDVNNRALLEQTGWIQRAPPAAIGDWYWSGQGETVYYTYDENSQKKTYTDSHGRRTSYEYDLRNRLWKTHETENTVPRTTETLYDFVGNKTQVTFPDTRTQQWLDYDAFGQPGRFIDERGNTTNILYWWGPMKKLGMVTTHRDKDSGGTEDQVTVFSYDFMGRPTHVWFPDGSYLYGSHEDTTYECKDGVTYFCDQPHTWTNRKGQTKYFHYDARGREDSNSWGKASGACDPAADNGAAPCIARQWDPANHLASIQNKFATINYGYDDAGQVLSESESISGAGGAAAVTGYRRYGNGTIWNLIYPNGMRAARAYSPQVRLQTVWDHGPNNWQLTINYIYTDDGKVDHGDYGNGTTTAYGYDGRSMINSVQHKRGDGANLSARTYYRDERDRITAYQKSTANSVNPMEDGRGNHYQYDAEGQLTDAWYDAVDPAGSYGWCLRQDHFAYDALGNRFGWDYVQTKGWMHFLRRDNGLNQYTSWENSYPSPPQHWGSGIFYDDNSPWSGYNAFPGNGVTMADGWLVASYNALNQPVAMVPFGWSNAIYFGYDPLGRCVKRWVGSSGNLNSNPATYFYYDGWNLIQEGSSSTDAQRQYVHGARMDEIVAQITPPNNWIRYFHYDASGNCTLQTDAFGNIAEQYEFDAFGSPYFLDGSGNNIGYSPWGNRFLFTGREWLIDLKLYDYRNRMYQPELGRFLQPDPKEFGAGDYNLYRYCHNDPVNRSDPTGLDFIDSVTTQEVPTIPGNLVGRTDAAVDVRAVAQADGSYKLRLDVTIVGRYVAERAFFHGKQIVRTRSQMDATHEHEEVEHHKDWQGFHDAKQGEVPNTRFPDRDAAMAAAKPLEKQLRLEGRQAKKEFEQHKPDSRWDKILRREGL
jgi:RHS repeat-associated protein